MGDKPPCNYPRSQCKIKSSLSKLTSNRPLKGRFLNLTKLIILHISIVTHFICRNLLYLLRLALLIATCPSEMYSLFWIHYLYGTDRQGSVPPYSICSPILYTRPTHTPPLRSAWFWPSELVRLKHEIFILLIHNV